MHNLKNSLACLTFALLLPVGCDDSSGTGGDGGPKDGAAGTGGSGGSGGSGGTGGSTASACTGVVEAEPNNTRDNATPYMVGSEAVGCLGSNDDLDFYSLTSPADPAGGYYELALSNVGDVGADVYIYTASDNSEIARGYSVSTGASLYFYWAAAPGQTYRISVSKFAVWNTPAKYTLKATYNKIDDSYEPNDTRDMAKPITLGSEVKGFVYAGFKAMKIPDADYQDWYSVTLEAGKTVTIKVMDMATNIRPQVRLYDPDGTEVNDAHMYNTTEGGSISITSMAAGLMKAGSYKLMLDIFSVTPEEAAKIEMAGKVPDNFKRPYKLTVAQP